jgi:hypothetical protein
LHDFTEHVIALQDFQVDGDAIKTSLLMDRISHIAQDRGYGREST